MIFFFDERLDMALARRDGRFYSTPPACRLAQCFESRALVFLPIAVAETADALSLSADATGLMLGRFAVMAARAPIYLGVRPFLPFARLRFDGMTGSSSGRAQSADAGSDDYPCFPPTPVATISGGILRQHAAFRGMPRRRAAATEQSASRDAVPLMSRRRLSPQFHAAAARVYSLPADADGLPGADYATLMQLLRRFRCGSGVELLAYLSDWLRDAGCFALDGDTSSRSLLRCFMIASSRAPPCATFRLAAVMPQDEPLAAVAHREESR